MKRIDLSKRKNRGLLMFIPAGIYILLIIVGFIVIIYELNVNPVYFIIPGVLSSFILIYNAFLIINYDRKKEIERIKNKWKKYK